MLEYWYRESPSEMVPQTWSSLLLTPGAVTSEQPAPIRSGMATMWMDAEGHLQWLQVIPQEVEASSSNPAEKSADGKSPANPSTAAFPSMDWNLLFAAAGLDPSHFRPADPRMAFLGCFRPAGRLGRDLASKRASLARGSGSVARQARLLYFGLSMDQAKPYAIRCGQRK